MESMMKPMDDNDSDGDGVPNDIDNCSATGDEPVTATGCPMFGGVLEGVLFESGSDKLTDSAQVVLNDAADALLNNPDMVVEVQAHTDSQGAAEYNLELSKKRALATVRYLMLRGVPSEQLLARAFGEAKPIESNDTAEGRQANRRVEFHVK
jgi:OOP family OmpA-OmpF porin